MSTLLAGDGPGGGPSKKTLRDFEKACVELARAGDAGESDVIASALGMFGAEPKDWSRRSARARRALKSPGDRRRRKQAAGLLERGIQGLAVMLSDMAPPRRRECASALLTLDDECVEAHEALGHARSRGGWCPPEDLPLLQRRTEILEAMSEARRLEVPVTTGVSQHPVLRTLYGRDGVYARCPLVGLEVHSVLISEAKLSRVLRWHARAMHLSRFLLVKTGDLEPRGQPRSIVILALGSQADYLRAVEEAHGVESTPPYPLEILRRVGSFRDLRGHRTASASLERMLQEQLLFQYHPSPRQPAVESGHLNWLSIRFLGIPYCGAVKTEEEVRIRRDARSSTEEARHEREMLYSIAEAGLAGRRTYLRSLVAAREDPGFTECFDDQVADVREERLLKSTFVAEYLHERDLFSVAWSETPVASGPMDAAAAKAFEVAMGESTADFERAWRRWILPSPVGLLQRLGSSSEASVVDKDARAALSRLDDARTAALKRAPLALAVDPDLSLGCQRHAEYLGTHPKVHAVWPDVHEQNPDDPEFTPEGSVAALSSVISFGQKEPAEAVSAWLATFYHRLPLLDPGLRRIGWGHARGIVVLDARSMVRVPSRVDAARWPAPGATGVPLRFRPELPSPVPGGDQSAWGYPVTLQLFEQWKVVEDGVTLRLYRGDPGSGDEVPCHAISPGRPLNPELAPRGAFGLIPKRALKARTRYCVVVGGMTEADWSFETASR